MLPVVGWKIYRADSSVWSSAGLSVHEVPDGIQAVIWYHAPPFRTLSHGEDAYEVDGRAFTGVWMDAVGYRSLIERALADTEWPA